MTTLYIANTTKQDHDFTFLLPERKFATRIPIPAGTQAPVVKGATAEEVDHIIAHHRRYGLKSAQEAAKSKEFVGMCYSVDTEVRFKDMRVIFDHNDAALQEKGVENLKQIAAAANAGIDANLQQAGIDPNAAHVELEVKEENTPGVDTKVHTGIEVVKDGQQPRRTQRGGRNR